jgi:acetyl-CoA synthetase
MLVSNCSALMPARPGFMGRAVPGHTVAIIDEEGQRVPKGALGQIAVRAPDPVQFLRYWENEQGTRDKFIGEWLVTGDLGIEDDEGYLRFVGRNDDVINSAGYRIGPGEIEDCLLAHPAVRLAAVIGVPDATRGEIVKAYLVLRQGVEPTAELTKDLQRHVRTRLSAHEYPREVEYIPELPLTTTGKIMRRVLRERHLQAKRQS